MKTRYVVLVGAVCAAIFGVLLYGALAPRGEQTGGAAAGSAGAREALDRPNVPAAGAPTAKVHIVEFLDPACGTCREFYPLVKKILADNPDKIRLSVRVVAFHKGADVVARLLHAADRQGQFWTVLTRLLATQDAWAVNHQVQPDQVWPQLATLELDMARLRKDMELPEVAAALARDMQDARTLNVSQTPEFFVNGNGLPEFGYQPLLRLVADAVKRAYP